MSAFCEKKHERISKDLLKGLDQMLFLLLVFYVRVGKPIEGTKENIMI